MYTKLSILTILSVYFSGIKYVNIVVQPSEVFIFKTFISSQTEIRYH